ncbi:Oidioi.mRNA.OKI2018_I69.XSR.g14105.t1.cds [Oikopleura dioica]|uniref:Oidioi.mRNA.OKI2018_I69.XSR.g14105.t1.cds n=1 Tax=Oikopleura dioica TaxID=34765 RepID=A0ABN7SDP4_OIKDI|nr:Oidioi.mRNA.OKI2018_I69.XSR.g14105.t1.cds [Oikopleura dioica]
MRFLRRFSLQSRSYRKRYVKDYDFMETVPAVEANLKEHGFRNIGGHFVDASKITNMLMLSADRAHYAYVLPFQPTPMQKLLASSSSEELLNTIMVEYNQLSDDDRSEVIKYLGFGSNQNLPTTHPAVARTFIDVANLLPNVDPTVLLPLLKRASAMEFDSSSNCIKQITTSIEYNINELGLIDCALLHDTLNKKYSSMYSNSSTEALLKARGKVLFSQMEIQNYHGQDNFDLDDVRIVCLLMELLDYPAQTSLLSTLEGALYNSAMDRGDSEIMALIECVLVGEVLLKDAERNKRSKSLSKYSKHFQTCEIAALVSAVTGCHYFSTDVTVPEISARVESLTLGLSNLISSSGDVELLTEYEERMEIYTDKLESLDVRNLGGIYALLNNQDIQQMYRIKDASYSDRAPVKLSSALLPSL